MSGGKQYYGSTENSRLMKLRTLAMTFITIMHCGSQSLDPNEYIAISPAKLITYHHAMHKKIFWDQCSNHFSHHFSHDEPRDFDIKSDWLIAIVVGKGEGKGKKCRNVRKIKVRQMRRREYIYATFQLKLKIHFTALVRTI